MSKLIALRLPDELAAKLDMRCMTRKQSKTEILIEAIERRWDETVPRLSTPDPATRRPIPLNIPGVFLGSRLEAPSGYFAEEPDGA